MNEFWESFNSKSLRVIPKKSGSEGGLGGVRHIDEFRLRLSMFWRLL